MMHFSNTMQQQHTKSREVSLHCFKYKKDILSLGKNHCIATNDTKCLTVHKSCTPYLIHNIRISPQTVHDIMISPQTVHNIMISPQIVHNIKISPQPVHNIMISPQNVHTIKISPQTVYNMISPHLAPT